MKKFGLTLLAFSFCLSFLFHLAGGLVVLFVEPMDAISDTKYEKWVKNVSHDRLATFVAPPLEDPKEIKKPEKSKKLSKDKTQDKNKKSAAKKEEKKPKEPPSPEERRQASRAKISQKGLLSAIGVADGGSGDMADIFGSDSVIGADIGSALKSSKKVGIARSNSGFKTTKKRGFEGSEKIDGVKIADAGKATLDSEKGQAELTGRIVATGFEVSNMSIDRNSVQKVLKRRNRSIQQCYERSLKGEAIEGKIKLTLIIDERGRVVDIKIVEDRLKSADALACILKILKRTKFPKPKDGFAEISKTWVFEASSN